MMIENNKDTISFRIFHSNPEDNGKTIARISPEIMQTFQIHSGDILSISGQQIAHIVCLPFDTSKTTQKDLPGITFLNDHVREIPQIFVSDVVFRNLMLWSGAGSTITVKKTGLTINTSNDKKTVTEASKIILATNHWFEDNLSEDYRTRMDFEALYDMIITKTNRISVPIHIEYNTQPQQFSSIILDVKPESQNNIWRIGKNTQFEFVDASLDVFSRNAPPRSGLHNLASVIPIVQNISINENITVTIPSLEIYKNGTKMNIYITERLHKIEETVIPDFQTGESRTMKRPVQRLQGISQFNMEVRDNLGNSYSVMPNGGSGGGSGTLFPSEEKDWEFYTTFEMSVLLIPMIDPDVRHLIVTIKEITWENHMHMRLPRTKPPHMTRRKPNQMQITIATGPWQFNISMDQ